MKIVKISSGETGKKYERNCIAISVKKLTENTKMQNRISDTAKSLLNKGKKIIERFSIVDILGTFKNKAATFFKELDKNTLTAVGAVAVCVFGVILFNAHFSFAYSVFFNDTQVAYVPNRAYVDAIVDEINSENAEYVSGADIIDGEAVLVPSIIKKNAFTDKKQAEENIKATSDIMIKAYAIEVDGKAYAALGSEDSANAVLEQYKAQFKTNDSSKVAFAENVCVSYQYVPAVILQGEGYAESRLGGAKIVNDVVTVASDTSVEQFVAENGISLAQFKALNPDYKNVIKAGKNVSVPVKKPVVSVITTDIFGYDEPIPFAESVVEDGNYYEGNEVITTKGVDGANHVIVQVDKVNGEVVSENILSSTLLANPVTQVRAIGTAERPANVGTGSFLRPYFGTISSRFGRRSRGNHTGVDFCGSAGDPIIAADNGTVIFSGWSGGYGKMIKIDHNNGYITYYAHCSSLNVNVGDVVKKGDLIARVGNTGNSTGPHLHFEIRHGDEICNPMAYVD